VKLLKDHLGLVDLNAQNTDPDYGKRMDNKAHVAKSRRPDARTGSPLML